MLITIHTVEDVADMIHKTNYGTWKKDYEACLALAKHMDSQNQDEPTVVNVREWVQRFDIFHGSEISGKTTVIPVSNGRFIAENF